MSTTYGGSRSKPAPLGRRVLAALVVAALVVVLEARGRPSVDIDTTPPAAPAVPREQEGWAHGPELTPAELHRLWLHVRAAMLERVKAEAKAERGDGPRP